MARIDGAGQPVPFDLAPHGVLQLGEHEVDVCGVECLVQFLQHVGGGGVHVGHRFCRDHDPVRPRVCARQAPYGVPEGPGVGEEQRRVEPVDHQARQMLGPRVRPHVVVPLQAVDPPQHGAVRPPRAPEDVEHGQRHGDRDPRQDTEQGHPGEGGDRQQELRPALPPQPHGSRKLGQGQRGGDDDGREGGLGQIAEHARDRHEHEDDQHRPDDPGEPAPGTGALGHRRPGAARADREALEEACRQVRGTDARHLLVAPDLLPLRAANADALEIVSARETRAMPSAPPNNGARSRSRTCGIVNGGSPSGS